MGSFWSNFCQRWGGASL